MADYLRRAWECPEHHDHAVSLQERAQYITELLQSDGATHEYDLGDDGRKNIKSRFADRRVILNTAAIDSLLKVLFARRQLVTAAHTLSYIIQSEEFARAYVGLSGDIVKETDDLKDAAQQIFAREAYLIASELKRNMTFLGTPDRYNSGYHYDLQKLHVIFYRMCDKSDLFTHEGARAAASHPLGLVAEEVSNCSIDLANAQLDAARTLVIAEHFLKVAKPENKAHALSSDVKKGVHLNAQFYLRSLELWLNAAQKFESYAREMSPGVYGQVLELEF